jgi:hypothetical protein
MNEFRHVVVILIAAAIAVIGAKLQTCQNELFVLCATIVGGEYGLARNESKYRTLTVRDERNIDVPPSA